MTTIFLLLFGLSLIILLVNLLFALLIPNLIDYVSGDDDPFKLSVVVSFKNEENNLGNLIQSLIEQDFPKDKYEVILIDDNSTDNSFQKASQLSKGKSNYMVVKADEKKYPGKKGALELGINKANNPYILVTDADCLPQKNWLAAYSKKFREGYDLLFGFAPFVQTKNFMSKMACFENLRSTILTFVSARVGLPYSAAARSIGFKKSSFEMIGGFSNTLETSSGDDDLLIREAVKNNWQIGIVNIKDSLVFTNSKETLPEYLNQKARHTKTSHHYLLKNQMLLGLWHSFNIILILSVFLIPFNLLIAIPFLIKIISDSILVRSIQKKLNYRFTSFNIPLLQVLYEVFLVINFLFSLKKNIVWKV